MINIIGGGPAGLILERICQIKQWDYKLFAEESSPPPNKGILLNYQSYRFLTDIGFSIDIIEKYQQLKVTQYNTLTHMNIHASDMGVDQLCYLTMLPSLHSELTNTCSSVFFL